MPSFRTSVTPHRRSAARFVESVRRKLVAAYADQPAVTQTAIADRLGVHRSVINRQLRGVSDLTLGRVAELAWCLGHEPTFGLIKIEDVRGNQQPASISVLSVVKSTGGFVVRQTGSDGSPVKTDEMAL